MTQEKTWEGSAPNFGKLLFLAGLALLILLILFLLSQGGGGGSSGGPANPQPPSWRDSCKQWEPVNEGLGLALDLVMSWFQPGGVFAGQSARTVLQNPNWKTVFFQAFGDYSDDYWIAVQYRALSNQVFGEWSNSGICYPNLRDDQMKFVQDVWGN